jgi:hypothetical protein
MPVRWPDECRLLEAGVDYITVTAQEVELCELMLAIGGQELSLLEREGFVSKKMGVEGYRGFGAKGLFYGTGKQGSLLRTTGPSARRLLKDLAGRGFKVTRVDLQASVISPDTREEVPREIVDAVRAFNRGAGRAGKRDPQLIDSGSRGSTAYFAQRGQARFGRIYDKNRESRGRYPAGTWRCEFEARRHLAPLILDQYQRAAFSEEYVVGTVRAAFLDWGLDLAIPEYLVTELPKIGRRKTDIEKQLDWLENVAGKVLEKVTQAGYGDVAVQRLFKWLAPEPPEEIP